MRDTWTCAWRELTRRRSRALAAVVGYALAAALFVVMVGLARHAKQAANEVLARTGTHFIAFPPARAAPCADCSARAPADEMEGFVAGSVPTHVFPGRTVEEVRRLPAVKEAAPFLLFRFRDPATGGLFTVGGFDPRYEAAVGTTCCAEGDLVAGRFLSPEDTGKVMLEEAYALARGLGVGDRVEVAGLEFAVAGVVNPGIRPAKADCYALLEDARRAVNVRLPGAPLLDEANVVLVEVESSGRQDEAMAAVKAAFPGFAVSTYACYRPAALVAGMNERAAILLVVVMCAGAVAFAMKSELASVVERRREIGILKAVGWTDGSVAGQVMAESVIQSLAGGAVGCLAGLGLLVIFSAAGVAGAEGVGVRASASPVVMAGALALALAGGLAAGLPPALKAAREEPAEALRR